MSQFTHLKQVAGHTGHDPAGLMVIVEPEGQLLQMAEQILPHLRLHLDADQMAVILNEIPKQHSDDIQNQHSHAGDNDRGVHLLGNVDIEHLVGHYRVDHANDRNKKGGQHIQKQHFFVGLVVTDKTLEHDFLFFLSSLFRGHIRLALEKLSLRTAVKRPAVRWPASIPDPG